MRTAPLPWGLWGRLAQLSIESVNVDSPLLIYWALREKESSVCLFLSKALGVNTLSLSRFHPSGRPESTNIAEAGKARWRGGEGDVVFFVSSAVISLCKLIMLLYLFIWRVKKIKCT